MDSQIVRNGNKWFEFLCLYRTSTFCWQPRRNLGKRLENDPRMHTCSHWHCNGTERKSFWIWITQRYRSSLILKTFGPERVCRLWTGTKSAVQTLKRLNRYKPRMLGVQARVWSQIVSQSAAPTWTPNLQTEVCLCLPQHSNKISHILPCPTNPISLRIKTYFNTTFTAATLWT